MSMDELIFFIKSALQKVNSTLNIIRNYSTNNKKTNIIFVDFHAETTAEKVSLGYYLDGRISGFVGTHTHIQTADERILPKGTAYITDLGMAGALNSSLGMKLGPIISRFQVQMPHKFSVETKAPMMMSGVCMEVDRKTGKAASIERFYIVDEELTLDN